jgi:hypothetical protein
MRKSLWIIAILFAAVVAPNAHATTLTGTLSLTGHGSQQVAIGDCTANSALLCIDFD